MSLCRINDLKVIGRGSDIFSFIGIYWHFVFQQVDFSLCCLSFEISFISLPPLTVLTRAHCQPLTITQEAAAALNQWTYAHWRQTWQRQQTLFLMLPGVEVSFPSLRDL